MNERYLHRILQLLHGMMMDEDVQSLLVSRPTVSGDFIDVVAVFAAEHESVQLITEKCRVENIADECKTEDGKHHFDVPVPTSVLDRYERGA